MDRAAPNPSRPNPGVGLFDRTAAIVARARTLISEHAARAGEATEARARDTGAADKALARAIEHADQELSRRLAKAEAERAEALRHLDAQRQEREKAARASWETRVSLEREHYERSLERADRACKEAVWLAETVFESARPRPGHEFEALCKRLDADLRRIAESEAFVASLWPRALRGMPPSEPSPPPDDEPGDFANLLEAVQSGATTLDRLFLPRLYRTGLAAVLAPLIALAAAAAGGFATGWRAWEAPAIAGAGTTVLLLAILIPLHGVARRRFRADYKAQQEWIDRSRHAAAATRAAGLIARDEAMAALVGQCRGEVERAKSERAECVAGIESTHQQRAAELERGALAEIAGLDAQMRADRAAIDAKIAEYLTKARETHAGERARAQADHAESTRASNEACEKLLAELRRTWVRRAGEIREDLGQIRAAAADACPTWAQRLEGAWSFAARTPFAVRLGEAQAPLVSLGPTGDVEPDLLEMLPDPLILPVALDVAYRGSLLIETPDGTRDAGVALAQTCLLRLLAAAPPGRARLTLFDPVGRGRSFAGLMRLADSDETLVGARIWTESRHMEQRLADLTEHIENVIQKYLREDYATIDEYNRVAGEIAEPYRYLVIADFPAGFTEDASARLASIIDAGARCGVYVVMLVDPAAKLPPGIDLKELRARAIVIESVRGGTARIGEPGLRDLPFTPDPPPSETQTVELLRRVGEDSIRAARVEVGYSVVEPREDQIWSRSCSEEFRVPVGRAGATKAQELRLGRGTSQHVLVAGKTGSGKSTLLHVLATSAMLWHAPSEIEFYLVDFKKGVEFKPYASGGLPHIRAVAIESDREFGLSVLQKLDAELRRRGDLFRERGVQSLAQFRERFPQEPMPRSILMIDEFQEFFVEDDRIAQDASLLLDRLVRQGRAFGIHVLLASQTLSGAYTLARSTVGQMAVRIALKCSETDSYLILSEDNSAARLLSRPGEAIYNDANGLVEGNNPFQVAWLSDDERHKVLERVAAIARRQQIQFEEPVFFEGNAAADLSRNRQLRHVATAKSRPVAPTAWLGEPVSIKDPTGAVLRRRGGSNLLIVGQRAETAAAMLASSVISLAAQHDARGERAPRFLLADGTPEDDPLSGRLAGSLSPLPHAIEPVTWRDAPAAVAEAHRLMREREAANRTDGPAVYLVLHGLHWLRALRRREDDLSFSFDRDENAPPPVDQQLKQVLIDGPRLGVFALAWCDTVGSLTRAMDRAAIAEFGNRVLMQMSANDSSMLIESTSASRLGLHRAIFFDEERGAEEKFRPYGLPEPHVVVELAALMC